VVGEGCKLHEPHAVETAAGRGHSDDLTAFVVPGAAPGGIVDVVAGGVLGDAVLGVPA